MHQMTYENPQLRSEVERIRAARRLRSEALGEGEWAIVDMARSDGLRSANPNSIFNNIRRLLFGISAPRPLGNERLEALRRFAVAAWFRDEIPTRSMRQFFAAGFSSNDAARVLAYVASQRGSCPEVEAWP
jgi:hypothetical protein